jgi:hypothetical protein
MNADHVRRAVRLALEALEPVVDRDWQVTAHGLQWTCWETVEHMADDLFTYAVQLAPAEPSLTTHVPFGWSQSRAGGPLLSITADPAAGQAGLMQVLEASGALLTGIVALAPADRRSFHNYGASDPGGFAAMGVVEVLVHMHDVGGGLGLAWQPPAELCAATLHRLFPQAPSDVEPWAALLWCTGRADLPGRPAPRRWTWDGRPR